MHINVLIIASLQIHALHPYPGECWFRTLNTKSLTLQILHKNMEVIFFQHGSCNSHIIISIPNIGIVETSDSFIMEFFLSNSDSTYLIGIYRNEEVLGDTVIKNLVDVNENYALPTNYNLSQNYPNPFNPTTKIEYSIPKTSFVRLKVYDILGREVAALVDEEKSVGSYNIEFNGNNLSSGIYFYKIQAGDYSLVKKMILIK